MPISGLCVTHKVEISVTRRLVCGLHEALIIPLPAQGRGIQGTLKEPRGCLGPLTLQKSWSQLPPPAPPRIQSDLQLCSLWFLSFLIHGGPTFFKCLNRKTTLIWPSLFWVFFSEDLKPRDLPNLPTHGCSPRFCPNVLVVLAKYWCSSRHSTVTGNENFLVEHWERRTWRKGIWAQRQEVIMSLALTLSVASQWICHSKSHTWDPNSLMRTQWDTHF